MDEDGSSEIYQIRATWKAHYVEIRQNMTLLNGKALLLKDILKEVSRRVGIFERKAKRVFKTRDVEILRRANTFLEKYTKSITHWVQDLVDASPDELKKGSVETPDFDEMRLSDIDSENEEDQMLVKLGKNPTSHLYRFPKDDIPAIKQIWIDLYQSSLLFFTLAKDNAKLLNHYAKMKVRITRFAQRITGMVDWNESQWNNSKTAIEKYTRKVDMYNRYVYKHEGPLTLSTGSPVEKDIPDEIVEAAIKKAHDALIKIIASMREVPTDPVQPSEVPTQPVQPSTVPTLPAKVPTQPAKAPTQPAKLPTQPAKPPAKLAIVKPEHTLVANPVRTLPLPSLLGDLRSPSNSPQPVSGSASRMKSAPTSTQRFPPTLLAKRSSEEVDEEVPKPKPKRRKTEVEKLATYYPIPETKKKKE